jgi:signal peptidase I
VQRSISDSPEAREGDASGEKTPLGPEGEKRRPIWRELPFLIVAALVIAILLKSFLLQAFFIPSGSMMPTLQRGDRVIVEKVSYRIGSPARGDIVVFERELPATQGDESLWTRLSDSIRSLVGMPTSGNEDLIKRVVAVEGDTVEGRGSRLYVNGERVNEEYLDGPSTYDFPPTVVGEDEVFVMGDNRSASEDSRVFGTVAESRIVGKAVVLIWPITRLGAI